MSSDLRQRINRGRPRQPLPAAPAFDPAEALQGSRLDPLAEVERPPTVIAIGGQSCMTAGSFSVLTGKAKARKGFLAGAIASAAASGRCSIEGITGFFPNGKTGVLYFDTEQGKYFGAVSFKRVCRAIGNSNPGNLTYHDLQQYTPAERLQMVDFAIMNSDNVSLVIVDGIRDLVSSINDESEATSITSSVLRWVGVKQIHVICILHQNKNDFNARGHIGTELINKAELTVGISKEKNESVSTVKAEFSRDKAFEPFSFTINEDGLPELTTLESVTNKSDTIMQALTSIFKENAFLSYMRLVNEYAEASGLSVPSAKRHIARARTNNWICRNSNNEYYVPATTDDNEYPF